MQLLGPDGHGILMPACLIAISRAAAFERSNFDKNLKIGRFDDFFGDGSFYLLHRAMLLETYALSLAPLLNHLLSFFLGADACHLPGALRPTDYLPLPVSVPIFPSSIGTCPGSLLQEITIEQSPSKPLFNVAKGPLFPDHDAAMDTVRKIQEFDAVDNVFVLIVHDLSLRDRIPLFPKTINGWRGRDLGIETRWEFCGELML
jgi:hypothetical protein